MQISTFPVCHVYFFPFNNFVQCLASFFSFYPFWYFYSLFCAFSPHYIIFYISFVFCQSVGRRLPCPRRPPRPLQWSPPPLPPLVAASLAPIGRRSLRSGLPCTMHESAASLHRPHISPPLPELPTRDVGPADPPPPMPPPSEARRHRLPPGKVGSCQGALAGG
jgi:hypothetical protein